MKKVVFVMGLLFVCTATFAQGRGMSNQNDDPVLSKLIEKVVPKFKQFTYSDALTGKTLEYNLFIPQNYEEGKEYPLIMFIGDASTAKKDITVPLTQGYGGLVWATDEDQAKHPSFVLVPQYSTVTVDDDWNTSEEVEMTIRLIKELMKQYSIDENRLYTTGQSMGGMMSFYFNISHPNFFAASIFVGSQWDTTKMASFAGNNFFYIVAEGDMKAPKGMAALKEVLEKQEATITSEMWSAKLPQQEQEQKVKDMLAKGNHINFITFTRGSVIPENGRGNEHMSSFNFAYKLTTVRDWLFKQVRNHRTTSLQSQILDPKGKELLIWAHAGDFHGTTANSIHSLQKAFDKGAHIASIDTMVVSKEYLRDMLSFAKGKILLAFDHPQNYLPELKEMATETGTTDIVILQETENDQDLMFVPLIDLDQPNALKNLKNAIKYNPCAIELRFNSDKNKLLPKAIKLMKGKCRVAFNTRKAEWVGGHSDDAAHQNKDKAWGELINKGGTIFITDQIKPFLGYIKQI